jgi:hypothetical protein
MIQSFVWKINTTEKETIEKLIKASFGEEIEQEIIDLSDTQSFKVTGNVVLAFGIRSFNLITAQTDKQIIQLTVPKNLTPSGSNKKHRAETYKALKELAQEPSLAKSLTLTDKDLEKFLSHHLIALKESLKNKKVTHWSTTTTTGKKIIIYLEEDEYKDYDILISFDELIAAKFAVEIFNIDSLTFVKKGK